MALDSSKNKMVTIAPTKKEYFFPGTASIPATTIYATDIQEAYAAYSVYLQKLTTPGTEQSTVPSKEAANSDVQ